MQRITIHVITFKYVILLIVKQYHTLHIRYGTRKRTRICRVLVINGLFSQGDPIRDITHEIITSIAIKLHILSHIEIPYMHRLHFRTCPAQYGYCNINNHMTISHIASNYYSRSCVRKPVAVIKVYGPQSYNQRLSNSVRPRNLRETTPDRNQAMRILLLKLCVQN